MESEIKEVNIREDGEFWQKKFNQYIGEARRYWGPSFKITAEGDLILPADYGKKDENGEMVFKGDKELDEDELSRQVKIFSWHFTSFIKNGAKVPINLLTKEPTFVRFI